jgi:hypothetical protein
MSRGRAATAGSLATILDGEMLEVVHGVQIEARTVPDSKLPLKSGVQVAAELGGRYLLRYVLNRQLGSFLAGSTSSHYVTPTPYGSHEAISFLNLPLPRYHRHFLLLLNPLHIEVVQGPRWVRLGSGIEYILPKGFPKMALVWGWEQEIT